MLFILIFEGLSLTDSFSANSGAGWYVYLAYIDDRGPME